MTERQRWLLLVLSLIMGFTGLTVGGILYTNSVDQRTGDELRKVQREQDRDMCDMLDVMLPTGAPMPSSSYGREQRAAIQRYQQRRC